MAHRALRRAVIIALFGAFFVAGFLINPTEAQVTNHAPDITSTPSLTLRADETYGYVLAATDVDNDVLTWKLTVAPTGAALTGSTVSWNPSTVGTYNVVAEVADGHTGFDTQVWQITVTPGHTAIVSIEPDANIEPIILGMRKQFTVTAADAEGNAVSTAGVVWSTDAAIGSIGTDGLFLAERGGEGAVTATLDGVNQSVAITVEDTRSDQVTPTNASTNTNTAAPANTNTATTNTNNNTNAAANANANENTNQESVSTNTNETITETPATTTDEKPCTNLVHWAIIVILLAYALVVILYYRYERTSPTPAWWILPLLVTIIALIIYYQQICPGEYLWWPWTIVGIGVLATIYYKGKRGSDSGDESQTKLPI